MNTESLIKNIHKFESDIEGLNSSLDNKANKDEIFTMANMGQDIKESMTGGSVAVVGKDAILTENIVDNQVTIEKLSETDDIIAYSNFAELTNNSDNTGNWCNNIVYKKGYVKQIKLKINGSSSVTGKIYLYEKLSNGNIIYRNEYNVIGNGEVVIAINKIIPYDFMLSSRCANLGYKDLKNGFTSGSFSSTTSEFTPTFTFPYTFAIGVEYFGIEKSLQLLEMGYNDVVKIPLYKFTNIPLMSSDNRTDNYRIVVNCIDNYITLNGLYIPSYSDTSGFNSMRYGNISTEKIEILPLNEDGHYVLYLFYNNVTRQFKPCFHNGISLIRGLETVDKNDFLVFCGLRKRDDFEFMNGINDKLVKVLFEDNRIITSEMKYNKWYMKTYNALGDSITRGENSLDGYNPMIGDRYTDVAKEYFGFKTVNNYGIGGSRITRHSDDNKNGMIDRFSEMADNADIVSVFGGTNDFGGNVEIGTIDSGNYYHFKFAFNELIKGLINKYPNATIYVITPLHRKDSKPDNVPNTKGYTLKDYVNTIKEICEIWGIPILDLWATYGISPFVQIHKSTYMPDGLHPIPNGMRKLAEKNNQFIENTL